MVPLFFLAKRKLYNAVRTPPMCKGPVGLGANLTLTFVKLSFIFSIQKFGDFAKLMNFTYKKVIFKKNDKEKNLCECSL